MLYQSSPGLFIYEEQNWCDVCDNFISLSLWYDGPWFTQHGPQSVSSLIMTHKSADLTMSREERRHWKHGLFITTRRPALMELWNAWWSCWEVLFYSVKSPGLYLVERSRSDPGDWLWHPRQGLWGVIIHSFNTSLTLTSHVTQQTNIANIELLLFLTSSRYNNPLPSH